MADTSLGDELNRFLTGYDDLLNELARSIQLSYSSLWAQAENISLSPSNEITIEHRLEIAVDGSHFSDGFKYEKAQLIGLYGRLAENGLALIGTYQLVTATEALLLHLIEAILRCYPEKMGAGRQIPAISVFEAASLEDLKSEAIQRFCLELAYKSPSDFGKASEKIFGFGLHALKGFSEYVELKATRDVFIHNQGLANEVYQQKAGASSRAKSGELLVLDTAYLIRSFQTCRELFDSLRHGFLKTWPCRKDTSPKSNNFE